jgi:hypothetical protein
MTRIPDSFEGATREEFAQEAIRALREAGVEGPLECDEGFTAITHPERGSFDLRNTFSALRDKRAEVRRDVLRRAAALWVQPVRVPETWEEAREEILLSVGPRIDQVVQDGRREIAGTPIPTPLGEIDEHLVSVLCFPIEGGATGVSMPLLDRYGVDVEEAFHAAGANLRRRSEGGWLSSKEVPGVWMSPWRDGFDASRLAIPTLFARVPWRGSPVVIAPLPDRLLWAGSEDEEGLFHLARLGRRKLDEHRTSHFLRPVRLVEGDRWEEWLPPEGHPAHGPLRLLRANDEARDYARQAELIREVAAAKGQAAMALPSLGIVQSTVDASPMTVTTWAQGRVVALPRADAIVFRRKGEVLGYAPWDDVARALPGALAPMGGYPVRHLAADFPDDWQLASLDLRPWSGPPTL